MRAASSRAYCTTLDKESEGSPVALPGLGYEDVVCVFFHMLDRRSYLLVGIGGKRLSRFF